jgi:hypothetical protein
MNDKSYVSIEQQVCLVCGQTFETGALLLDRRLRASMDRQTVTGWELCAEHRRLYEAGFVALIECDPARSGATPHTRALQPGQAYRTGQWVHLRRETFARVFNVEMAPGQPCCFVEPGVIERLKAMVEPSAG